jgi:hypothetical protein
MQRHLLALVPGQRPAQLRRPHRQGLHEGVADCLAGVPLAGQVHQDGEPAGPAGQGGDRRAVERAGDQVTLPVPGLAAAGGSSGPVADHRHPSQRPGPAGVAAAVRLTPPSPGPQRAGHLPAQPAQLRPVDGLIDRLMHQMPAGLAGELGAQRAADLLRAPAFAQPAGHELAQHRISVQLAAAGPGPAPGSKPLRRERPVAATGRRAVAPQLPADRRRAAS